MAIAQFLSEQKSNWLGNKKAQASDTEETVQARQREADKNIALQNWLLQAAKDAYQLTQTTHPSKFSHPETKNVTSIVMNIEKVNDGFIHSRNISTEIDVSGNASALGIYKFLTLTLSDGKTILDHLEEQTDKIKDEFATSTIPFAELREQFLAIKKQINEAITHNNLKQVYFPVDHNDHHLLSILTPSGILVEMKKRVDEIQRWKEDKQPSDKLHGLSIIGYGGSKSQNISMLNSKIQGRAYLLASFPPFLEKRSVALPKKNFFETCIHYKMFKEIFDKLNTILNSDFNNIKVRKRRDRYFISFLYQIIDKAVEIRNQSEGWSNFKTYQNLPLHQRIWLDDYHLEERNNSEEWLDKVIEEITRAFFALHRKYSETRTNSYRSDDTLFVHIIEIFNGYRDEIR